MSGAACAAVILNAAAAELDCCAKAAEQDSIPGGGSLDTKTADRLIELSERIHTQLADILAQADPL